MRREALMPIFEFVDLKKTGVSYSLDRDPLKHSDGGYVLTIDNREFLKGAFVHINRPDMIGDAVNQALHPTMDMAEKSDRYRSYFFPHLDGHASARLKATVERLLAEGTHANQPQVDHTIK